MSDDSVPNIEETAANYAEFGLSPRSDRPPVGAYRSRMAADDPVALDRIAVGLHRLAVPIEKGSTAAATLAERYS